GVGGSAGSAGVAGAAGSGCGDLMSDPANCGWCGHSCLGAACVDGRCALAVIASEVTPIGLALQNSKVFFTDDGVSAVRAVPKDGSGTPVVIAPDQVQPGYIAIDGDAIYWTLLSDGSVMKLASGGAGPVKVGDNFPKPVGIAAYGGQLWVTDATTGYLWKLPTNGGVGTVFATLDANGFAEGIARDGQTAWVAMNATDAVVTVDASGKLVTPFVQGQGNPAGVAIDDGAVYWANQNSGELRRKRKNGGEVVTLAIGLNWPAGVAVDDQYVYCAEVHGKRIVRVAK
ncbi:MAG TPA: hypothetical protein PLI95_25750, partial [Polyangiaceae bacterium]|nr:hypothetical protein [Polyangiaceae bacterium]